MKGFSLLEVLISLALFALVLVMIHAAQIIATKQIQNAYYLNIANQQLVNLEQQLRQSVNHDCFNGFLAWNQQNHLLLPEGNGVMYANYPYCNFQLTWKARSENQNSYLITLFRTVRLP